MHAPVDVTIIGGGLMGCATAFKLAQQGLTVTVLEQATIGSGSTGRSSSIIRQHYSNELTAAMALYSLRAFQSFKEDVGEDCGFHETGFLALVGEGDLAGLQANIALQKKVGIDTRMLTPAEVVDLVPSFDPTGIAAAAYEPESGYADAHLTVHGYASAARRLGVTILQDCPVTGIRFQGHRVAAVATPRGDFSSNWVINCAGPWAARVAAMADLEVPVNACRAQVAVFRRPEGTAGHPVVLDFVHASYFRDETGGLTLVGVIDPREGDDVVDPDSYDDWAEDEFVADVGERWITRCPGMDASESTGGYSGLYAVTPDWHPVIEEVPAGSGHVLCVGFSGHGFKLAPAVSTMVSDLVVGATDPTFSVAAFRLDRFAAANLVSGSYAFSITG